MTTFTVTNTNDSGAGSLRQAILDSNAAGGTNTIEFDPTIAGQTITILSTLPVSANADIDGDVIISMTENARLFTLDTDGISLESSLDIDYDIDDAFGFASAREAIFVTAENAIFTNTGSISTAAIPENFGDRSNAIQVTGDNFTLNNLGADASIVTEGRSAIEVFNFDDQGNFESLTVNVVNEGLLESTDDAVRIINGSVTNSGTIRTTGTFDFGGATGLQPGEIADGILFFGSSSDDIGFDTNVIDNLAGGLIDGARSGVFLTGGGTVNNAGTITADVSGILSQGGFTNLADGSQVALTADFVINNTGSIIREGGNFITDFNDGSSNAAIGLGGGLTSATITNSNLGVISSTDLAISVFASTTLINESGATIISDSDGFDADGIGPDGVAFRGAEDLTFIIVNTSQVYQNTQGITAGFDDFTGSPALIIPSIGTVSLFSTGGQVPAGVIGDLIILPLVDIEATSNQIIDQVIFQRDANDELVFPDPIDVISPTLGPLTVSFINAEEGFNVTDSNGDPVFDVPADVNFDDVITNDGTIIGDIITGLGDDIVTNTGLLDGDVSLGVGDDTFISNSTTGPGITIDGGEGSDTVVYDGDGRTVVRLSNGFVGGQAAGDSFISIENIHSGSGDDSLQGANNVDNILDGGAGNDVLRGLSGDDTLFGRQGNDTLEGGNDNDALFGGAGNDSLFGGIGDDILDGGVGIDTLVYDGGRKVLINLNNDTAGSAGARGDTISNFENVIGGNGNDTILGANNEDNILDGGSGDDILRGLSGDDTLIGGGGDDRLEAMIFSMAAMAMIRLKAAMAKMF